MAKTAEDRLYRYTNLASLMHVLQNKCITLLDYAMWDDWNDRYFLDEYCRRLGLNCTFALCFSMASERYHHWRVFAHGADGVRIEFKRQELLDDLDGIPDLRAEKVVYKKVHEIEPGRARDEDLPFVKRKPYADEKEFRLIWSSCDSASNSRDFPISLTSIRRVTLSPWLPPALAPAVRATLKSIPDCNALKVYRSTLRDNGRWRRYSEPT